MHVVLLAPSWPIGFPNGIVTYVHHLKCGLEGLGHKVSVLAVQGVVEGQFPAVYPIEPAMRSRLLRVAVRLARRIGIGPKQPSSFAQSIVDSVLRLDARDPVDVVEMEESFGWCGHVAPRLPMPLVVRLHGPAFLSLVDAQWQSQALLPRIEIEGQALRRARSIVAASVSTMVATVKRYGLSSDTVTSIPNPVAQVDASSIWHQDRCDPSNILFVGRFDRRKGGDAILAAFAALAAKRSDLTLTFVGPDAGLAIDSDRTVDITSYIASQFEPAVAARIHYVGSQSTNEVHALRTKAAVTVCASRGETFGYIVAEAMMQACPIVAFDVNGVNELLSDGQTALLVPLDDLSVMAASIERLLDNPEQAALLGSAARRAVSDRCGVEVVARQMAQTYRDAIARSGSIAGAFA